jgi:hypothetical protein
MLSCIKIKVASMFVSCTWIRMGTHSSQPWSWSTRASRWGCFLPFRKGGLNFVV